MNAVLENIYTRRSVRSYKPDPVPEELLEEIVKAGLYAPSAMNGQSWHLTVLTGDAVERFHKFAAEKAGRNAYYGAPAIILVFADKKAAWGSRDGSLALGNMMLAAHSLGLGTCWINIINHIFDGEDADALAAEWGIPAGYAPIGSIEVGYAAEPPRDAAPRREGTVNWIRA